MKPTYHYDKNHKMIYVGQKVRAGGEEYTVDMDVTDGHCTYLLRGKGEPRRLNEFGAQQLEVING